jgi:hypothetical protein
MRPEDPTTWPKDLIGFRRESDCLVFRCACNCGGHVLIPRKAAVATDVERASHHPGKSAKCFGPGYYVEGHEFLGIIGQKYRTGKRTQLQATA